MSVDEARIELRTKLQELVGVSGAEILLDQPPGGWNDVVTNHTLDLRFAASEERFDRKLDALESRLELRFAAIDARFDRIDARFDHFDQKFDLHRAESDARMDRRLRAQTWMTISMLIAAGSLLVAAMKI